MQWNKELTPKRAVGELTFASALWGFGFIAAVWGLQSLGYFSLTATRFGISFIAASLWACSTQAKKDYFNREQALLAFGPGLFLSLTLILQTWGLAYTTATRSGFITCLYILFVPVIEAIVLKRALSKWHFVFVFLALAGTALICDIHGEGWNKGDFITLLCAFTASAQIAIFGVIGKRIGSPVAFNAWQSFWAFLLPAALALSFDKIPQSPFTTHALIGIAALGIGSSTFAFMLQVRAQKIISPSTASMIFLLESPFALLFSILFLHEHLKIGQWLGAAIVLFAVWLSTQVARQKLPKSRA